VGKIAKPAHGESTALPHAGNTDHLATMTLDLTDDEAAALAKHLRQAIDNHRYPLAPRLDPLKSVLAKLEPAGAGLPRQCGVRFIKHSAKWEIYVFARLSRDPISAPLPRARLAGPSPGPPVRMGLPPARAVRSGCQRSLRSFQEAVRPSLRLKRALFLTLVTHLSQI
jgi:hypothetical protein